MDYFVAKYGSDVNPGTEDAPFLTINKAASVAYAGDTVTVREGVYREWVDPSHPGTESAPIVYQAAEGEQVVITGFEEFGTWNRGVDGIWTAKVSNSVFGSRHPYQERVAGDWMMHFGPEEERSHTGSLYLDGKGMREVFRREDLPKAEKCAWFAVVDPENTTFFGNFQGVNPNEHFTEYTARPNVFWPEKTNMDYIIVRGLSCGTQPPTGRLPRAYRRD